MSQDIGHRTYVMEIPSGLAAAVTRPQGVVVQCTTEAAILGNLLRAGCGVERNDARAPAGREEAVNPHAKRTRSSQGPQMFSSAPGLPFSLRELGRNSGALQANTLTPPRW